MQTILKHEGDKTMSDRKTVQIPIGMFLDICNYFFRNGEESPLILEQRILDSLTDKLVAMKRHDEYHTNQHKDGGVPPT